MQKRIKIYVIYDYTSFLSSGLISYKFYFKKMDQMKTQFVYDLTHNKKQTWSTQSYHPYINKEMKFWHSKHLKLNFGCQHAKLQTYKDFAIPSNVFRFHNRFIIWTSNFIVRTNGTKRGKVMQMKNQLNRGS